MTTRARLSRSALAAATVAVAAGAAPLLAAGTPSSPQPAVGLRILRLVDTTRQIRLPTGRTEPRTLVTYVRYPAVGTSPRGDRPGAAPLRSAGPFPLVVFGHGYAVTPFIYRALLRAWTRAGYVVAAPVFPLGNADAPGGPNESDIVNQPADMSFVISQLLARSKSTNDALSGLIDPARIAVAGHSDGAETALAVAYDRPYLDRRVRAAIVLSGAEIPGSGRFTFPSSSPPLLATQGSADTLNRPSDTRAFFDIAPRPKYLLLLHGAKHLPPYTTEQPQLGIVERVTIAFLDHYFEHGPQPRLQPTDASLATLLADP